MMAAKKPFRLICKECGKEAQPNADKSTSNWDVLPVRCECGASFKISI
jgi:lysyl-tRNA synthetase class I